MIIQDDRNDIGTRVYQRIGTGGVPNICIEGWGVSKIGTGGKAGRPKHRYRSQEQLTFVSGLQISYKLVFENNSIFSRLRFISILS